jgi:hypothetical protein
MGPYGGTQNPSCTINTVVIQPSVNSAGWVTYPIPVTLPSGSIVADGGTVGFYFVGIEE